MKFIFKQSPGNSNFDSTGIINCYLKELSNEKDISSISKKDHHHTFFETHIIISGHQCYKISGKKHTINSGNLIIIPPNLRHTVTESANNTRKISVTFGVAENSYYSQFSGTINKCATAKLPKRIEDSVKYIIEESKNHSILSEIIIQNRIFEIIVNLMRICGFTEEGKQVQPEGEDVRLSMAKQYIKDNIEFNPKLPDVASYCYIGTKQLTRLFKAYEKTTPALYIQSQKFRHIEELLIRTELSLKEISEKMSFSSEYHLNSFFKKFAGTPPGEYRTIMGK